MKKRDIEIYVSFTFWQIEIVNKQKGYFIVYQIVMNIIKENEIQQERGIGYVGGIVLNWDVGKVLLIGDI